MKLRKEVKRLIELEFKDFKDKMYSGLSPTERKEYGMVYTPAAISISMIEKFDLGLGECPDEETNKEGFEAYQAKQLEVFSQQVILDPCCGSGNLLVACLLAGADASKLCGNELNSKMVRLARRRIQDICDNNLSNYPSVAESEFAGFENIINREKFRGLHHHIHVGDATNQYCLTHFGNRYNYNMTEQDSAKEDPSQGEVEDNVSPSYEDGLLMPHEFGTVKTPEDITKNKWSKYIYKNIVKDIGCPVATDKELALTKEDMEEITTAENMRDAEEVAEDTENKFKADAKREAKDRKEASQKTERITTAKTKIEEDQKGLADNDLFAGLF